MIFTQKVHVVLLHWRSSFDNMSLDLKKITSYFRKFEVKVDKADFVKLADYNLIYFDTIANIIFDVQQTEVVFNLSISEDEVVMANISFREARESDNMLVELKLTFQLLGHKFQVTGVHTP